MKKNELSTEKNITKASKSFQRRKFLSASAGVVVMLGLGFVGAHSKKQKLLRPPGGQNEDNFIAKCIKCDRCRSVCHTSVIGVASLEDGFMDARTPLMKFHLGYCDFCNKCVEVCPTQALEPFNKQTVKIGIATLTDTCIALNYGGCTLCFESCEYKAISLDEQKRPIVDADKCNGCGVCEKICPALILRSYIGGKMRGIEVRPIEKEVIV